MNKIVVYLREIQIFIKKARARALHWIGEFANHPISIFAFGFDINISFFSFLIYLKLLHILPYLQPEQSRKWVHSCDNDFQLLFPTKMKFNLFAAQ